jgi:hypothetical protein
MKRTLLTGALLVALAATVAIPAGASTFVAMSDQELVAQSDAVVVGEVLETFSYWNDQHTMIFTEAIVSVQRVVTGDAPALINVRTAGGVVGSYKVEATGFPTFRKGQRQLLFVHGSAAGTVELTGYRQGQFFVQRTAEGREMAVPALGNVRLLSRSGELAPRPRTVPLESLISAVQTIDDRVQRGPITK